MPSELSMQMSEKAADRHFYAENGSKFEPIVIKVLCEPLQAHIPARVTPNTISLVTHAIVWITAILAALSPHLPPFGQAMALIGAGIGMFLAMLGDCVDGLHARRTNQCSKLGEMMDHWLDAIVVPLASIGITCALELPMWGMVTVNITAAMIYNAQLVLYHHSGRFIHPEPATGVEGQFGLSLGYIALAGFFYYVERDQPWLHLSLSVLAVAGTFVQLKCSYFYYPKLKRLLSEHLWFAATCSAFGALYLLGVLQLHFFLATVVFSSFRICGTYVLRTIVKERYDGRDLPLLFFALAIAAVHYGLRPPALGPISVENAIAALACLYAIARNFVDFGRRYAALTPKAG